MINDYRLDPYTNVMNAVQIQGEKHTVPTSSPYTVRLNEVPRVDSPSTVKVSYASGGTLTEVAATPAAGQYFPDYLTTATGIDGWNTGTLLFNAADAGREITVNYYGTGTLTDSRLGQMLELDVTGSTASELKPSISIGVSGSDGYSASISALAQHTGIAKGKYTLLDVVNKLVKMSHTHTNSGSSSGWNCHCDCNCCLLAGTKIRMADGTERAIETLTDGDMVIGLNGPVKILGLHRVKLGKKRVMMTFSDRSIFFTGEHLFLINMAAGLAWGTADLTSFLREHNGHSFDSVRPILGAAEYVTEDGWKIESPEIAREFDSDTTCYDLILDGDGSYIANGYIVRCYDDEITAPEV